MIKAIETIYNGYRFRSRLEARWAVFFDAVGIKYEYEKEGYELPSGWYLPDFWLPDVHDRRGRRGVWAEIKGETTDTDKCWDLAKATRQSVNLFVGYPHQFVGGSTCDLEHESYQITVNVNGDSVDCWEDGPMFFHKCKCRSVKIEFYNDYFSCFGCKGGVCHYDDATLIDAASAAKKARFEHGAIAGR